VIILIRHHGIPLLFDRQGALQSDDEHMRVGEVCLTVNLAPLHVLDVESSAFSLSFRLKGQVLPVQKIMYTDQE
jgi:hypothetical protein